MVVLWGKMDADALTTPFGSSIPYSEPGWYSGKTPSPYYGASHAAFRARVRKFVAENLIPHVDRWEEECATEGKEVDAKAIAKAAVAAGVYAPQMPSDIGGTPLPDGEVFDAFHDLIWIDELSRVGASGLIATITLWTMALPPILEYASERIKNMVVRPVLRGEKSISLCISEPQAGSDVANLRTVAEKSPDGDCYIISGQKKWITGAMWADYFTVAARTGGPGASGVSLFLVDAKTPGVSVRRMKLQGNWLGGTCVVTFDDVRVSASNLIGKENEGFKPLMVNFNHERFVIATQAVRQARLCIEDAISFAKARKTFGKRLIKHDIIRQKIAAMARATEAAFAFGENLAYQMKCGVSSSRLGGPMALYKVLGAEAMELCAREASQILGGSSYTREGKGRRVERMYREVRSYAIPGGSIEILELNAIKMARL